MLVKDLMTPDPVNISPLRSVAEAADIMQKQGIRHLPVINDENKLVGLVTRASLGKALPGMGTGLTRFEFNYLTSSTAVSDVMIKEPALIKEDEGVEDAARIMNSKRISSLLVMRDGLLVGIITDTDLFGALLELLGARRPGLRLTVHVPNRTGELAKVTAAIADRGGNLSAVGGWYVKGARNVYGAVLKIEDLTPDQVTSAIEQLPEASIVDLRGEAAEHGE